MPLQLGRLIVDFQNCFPCRGAAFDPSPAFQRREWPSRSSSRGATIELVFSGTRRVSGISCVEVVHILGRSTVAPRLWRCFADTRNTGQGTNPITVMSKNLCTN